MRLLRALREVRPSSTRELLSLAAEQMRRELLDLARHYYGPLGEGANHASTAGRGDSSVARAVRTPPAPAEDPAELEKWCSFHREVERLPTLEREVVGLVYYHGWTQAEVAALFHINERTLRRHWHAALHKLHGTLKVADV